MTKEPEDLEVPIAASKDEPWIVVNQVNGKTYEIPVSQVQITVLVNASKRIPFAIPTGGAADDLKSKVLSACMIGLTVLAIPVAMAVWKAATAGEDAVKAAKEAASENAADAGAATTEKVIDSSTTNPNATGNLASSSSGNSSFGTGDFASGVGSILGNWISQGVEIALVQPAPAPSNFVPVAPGLSPVAIAEQQQQSKPESEKQDPSKPDKQSGQADRLKSIQAEQQRLLAMSEAVFREIGARQQQPSRPAERPQEQPQQQQSQQQPAPQAQNLDATNTAGTVQQSAGDISALGQAIARLTSITEDGFEAQVATRIE